MYVFFVTLFHIFDKHREKYAKPDFVKFIPLEINLWELDGFFFFFSFFFKYKHASFSGNKR